MQDFYDEDLDLEPVKPSRFFTATTKVLNFFGFGIGTKDRIDQVEQIRKGKRIAVERGDDVWIGPAAARLADADPRHVNRKRLMEMATGGELGPENPNYLRAQIVAAENSFSTARASEIGAIRARIKYLREQELALQAREAKKQPPRIKAIGIDR